MLLDIVTLTWHDHEVQSTLFRAMSTMLLALGTVALLSAQTSPRKTAWEGVYTAAQASRGVAAFNQNCSACHTLAAEGKSPLAGEPFWKSFAQKSVGELVEYVSANMPNGRPGSLDESVYRDIVAAILQSNDFPAGKTELQRDNIAGVQIIPKDGNMELPANALARIVGCLARSGSDWVVTNATVPERAERPVQAGEEATRALGSRTIPLKFVVTRLDSLAGSRVAVNGLLIGAGGVDGLNVTTVSRVANKCP